MIQVPTPSGSSDALDHDVIHKEYRRMSTTSSPIRALTRADSRSVTNNERGDRIKRRRLALGIGSHSEFERETGRDRGTLKRAEEGDASPATYDWIEAWLARQEEENGHDADPEPPAGTVQLTVRGILGVEEILVTGPVEHSELFSKIVADVLDEARKRQS